MRDKKQDRLNTISSMLKEIRFSEGLRQDDLVEYGISRRQVQRGEHGLNMTLTTLFTLLDFYGCRLNDFFQEIE